MDPFSVLSAGDRELLEPAPRPDKVTPMKAVLTDDRFSDDGWIYERKLDGVRCLAHRYDGGAVQLLSRTDRSMNGDYPGLVQALAEERCRDFVVDGELVAFDSRGVTSFQRLQRLRIVQDAGGEALAIDDAARDRAGKERLDGGRRAAGIESVHGRIRGMDGHAGRREHLGGRGLAHADRAGEAENAHPGLSRPARCRR